jgi:uncharacterized protein YcbK (DUF882 family)
LTFRRSFVAALLLAPVLAPFALPLPARAIDAQADHKEHMRLLGATTPQAAAPESAAKGAAKGEKGASKGARRASRPQAAGAFVSQTGAVQTSCFPAALRTVLAEMQAHFGRPVIVTSGFRSHGHNRRAGGARRSLHTACMAADVQIAGVSPRAIAQWARSHSSIGGVGTYRHTRSVHVDVGVRVASWGGARG